MIKSIIKGLFAIALISTLSVQSVEAKKMSDLKVYINPGHGGYTSNDRPIRIYPFEANDTLGYWESKSNLYKGLHMYHILDSLGATPYLSRTKNTEDDDRSLSGIAAEANQLGADIFLSIHSNAGEDVNTPLMLYRENTIGTPRYPENVTLSKIIWKNLHSSQLPHWTRQTEYVCGDLTFYQNMWQGGLGVLRTLYVVGLLSEGSMHEHRPEAHRLMNDDYLWLEAWHFVKSIMEFYDTEDRFVTGNVAGVVYDNHNLREKDMPVSFHNYGRDRFCPLNFATVELRDQAGNVVQKRTTDDMHNGIFVFRNVKPGNYTVYASRDDYYAVTTPVTVVADQVTYQDMPLALKREFPLEITSYSPKVADGEPISCATTIDFGFNTDVDTESFEKAFSITPAVDGYFTYSETYHKATFTPTLSLDLNTTYTVRISTEAKTPDPNYATPNLKEPLEFTFTTKGRNRLEVIDQFPADKGTVHYVSPTFEVRFDNSINYSNIYDLISITDSKGKALTLNKRASKFNQLSNGYGNAVFTVNGSLTKNETYHVSLSGQLRDRESLPMAEDLDFDFIAVDAAEAHDDNIIIEDFENESNLAYDPEHTYGIGNVLPTSTRSTTTKLFDKSGGRMAYTFTDNHGGEIVWNYNGPAHLFNPKDVFGAYVNGDFNNHELWVGFTSGTATKYFKLCDLDFLGWKYIEINLDQLDKEFAPYVLSNFKLIQKSSPITQKGVIGLDNLSFRQDPLNGVEDIVVDGKAVRVEGCHGTITITGADNTAVKVYTADGRMLVATQGDTNINVAPGIYIVTVGNESTKVTVD